MTEGYLNRFSGIARLYGMSSLEIFARSHVAIVGIGGVGSWTTEALARSGIGELTLIDLDDVCVTNTNRQVHALHGSVGRAKVAEMTSRILAINPEARVHAIQEFYTAANADRLISLSLSAVADAIDALKSKVHLLAHCKSRGIPIVTSGGAGGRVESTRVEVADLARTHGCALLHQVRRILRAEHGFPTGEKKPPPFGISAIFSGEAPRYPTVEGCISLQRPKDLPAGLRCDAGYGSVTHVTAAFGLAQAGEVLRILSGLPSRDVRCS